MSEIACAISLKNVASSRIYKKRQQWRNIYLNEKLGISSNSEINHLPDVVKTASKRRKYKALDFSTKDGSSKGSTLYTSKEATKQQSLEITIIPETETDGEREGNEQIPPEKMANMIDLFKPKVKSADTVYLSDTDSNS